MVFSESVLADFFISKENRIYFTSGDCCVSLEGILEKCFAQQGH